MEKTKIKFYDEQPQSQDMRAEILAGLQGKPKRISPKYFYDQQGAEMFEQITRLPEYYLTRTEVAILRKHAAAIAARIQDNCFLIEYGASSSEKIRILLESIRPRYYMPLDISRQHLLLAAKCLAVDFPWLEVHAACVDYSRPLDVPFAAADAQRIAFFPGSSIGNLEPSQAIDFLRNVCMLVNKGGGLLIGIDLKKDPARLNAAYNDSRGITAAFNLNVLAHLNKVLGAGFQLNNFAHYAYYNESVGRVEMHLRSQLDQIVSVASERIRFSKGETIHTENSYKYTTEEFSALASRAGFAVDSIWRDAEDLFAVLFLRVVELSDKVRSKVK